MDKLFFVTGASGTGKTTAVKTLEGQHLKNVVFCYFDSIGIPSNEEMIAKYGSGEEFQKQETINWVRRIKEKYLSESDTVLDGQINQSFIVEACKLAGVTNYEIVVFVCEDEARDKRLIERGQPELANQDMSNWNRYLKEQGVKRGDKIIDTTSFIKGQAAELLAQFISERHDQ